MVKEMNKPTSSIKDVLKIMDRVLGLSLLFLFILILAYKYYYKLELYGALYIFLFLIYNLIISQISIKAKKPYKVEFLRNFIALTFLCPIGLLIKAPFDPFWFSYLIMVISSGTIFYEVTGKNYASLLVSAYGILSYIIASIYLTPEVPFIYIIFHSWVMATFTLLMNQVLKLVDMSYKRENYKRIELHQALTELEAAQQSLIHSSRLSAIGEMAGGIAHEINNPLTIISGSVFKIKQDAENDVLTDENLKKHLKRITDTISRITHIVNSLKIVSRESDDLEAKIITLREILNDTLSICTEKFRNNGVNLHFDINDESFSAKVNVDHVQISQVFLNLLNNSYDAIEGRKEKWIRIETKEEGKYQIVKIIDSGTGINNDYNQKVFEPFFTTKEVGKGTGLGLSISKSILEKNRGVLLLDSHAKNTTLIVKIPKA